MNKSIIGAWAVSVGVAFYAGFSTGQPEIQVTDNKISKNPAENTKINSPAVTPTSVTDTKSANRLRVSTAKDARPPVSVVMADLKALLGSGNMMSMDMAAFAESYNLIKDLSEGELVEALDLLSGDINDPANMMPLMLILGKYAEFDPKNAMAYYESSITSPQTKMMALSSIMSSWAKTDPEGAYEWFQSQESENDGGGIMGGRSMGMVQIVQGLAKKDLRSAIEKLNKLETVGFEAQMAATGIASALKDKEEFIEFFKQTEDLDNKNIKNSVLQNWVMRNPQEAVDWVETIEDEKEKSKYNQQVLSGWMNSSPKAAAEWYLNSAEDKNKAAEKVVQKWSWRNPKAAMEWVESQEGIDNQKSMQKILESSIYQNPDFAINNMDKLEEDKSRQRLSERIYSHLKNQSKTKAEEFLESSPFKDEIVKKYSKKKKK